MKNCLKAILFVAAIFLFQPGIAQKTEVKPAVKSAREVAEKYLQNLSEDVQLTDSQRVELQKYAIIHFTTSFDTNAKSDKKELISLKQSSYQNFLIMRDSILTPEQRDQLILNQNERRDRMIRESKSKNKK